ncbi:PREDICTED: uncharacterized protein LOC106817709 [Priapulus caudatus]|uniref:Uncharacterized protein LOC106817709 n=1 Tax=Priapulus caudatus TaxID=37621 RepID=A0ABM1F0B4_PRICU|nr:PREDICTED: uncharacterized protein LOC106817709 [Priapulus caudatus]
MLLAKLLPATLISKPINLARSLATSLPLCGQHGIVPKKRKKYPLPANIRHRERVLEKFPLTGKHKSGKASKYYQQLHYTGVQRTGFLFRSRHVLYKDAVPDIVVPNLTKFALKPYVSYRVPDVTQSEFTSKDLFDTVYARKVIEDFEAGNIEIKSKKVE